MALAAIRRVALLAVGGGFLAGGALFVVVSMLALVVNPHPVLIPFSCVGGAAAALGWLTIFRSAYSVVVGHEGVTLAFVTGGERLVTWEQVIGHRNLFLGRRELLDVYNPDPGKFAAMPVVLLLRYCVDGKRTFAVFMLPGVGPLLGPMREYRTALDEHGGVPPKP